ncbi:MAG: MFS transporter [Saprospiraceae bacterium]|nr:MFS transporter [Saprospiraceae bacterium]
MSTHALNDKKIIRAWAIFDWANSAYSLVISTAIFPIYFIAYTPEIITLGGIQFTNAALYSFAVTFSYVIIACLSPILSGIADYSGRRKFFLHMFTLIGSIACMILYLFKGEPQLWLATTMFILATVGFSGSLVFYDSFLPLIVTEDRYNSVSAKGFTYGYIGSVILLIAILLMGNKPEWFGFADSQGAYRLGFLMVGLWWVGFAQYTLKFLPKDKRTAFTEKIISNGFNELKKAFRQVWQNKNIVMFLTSYFFYSAGVQTVIYLATVFASKELGFESTELIIIVLLLQLVAIVGAYLFSLLGNVRGNRLSIMIMLVIWIGICIGAYYTQSKSFFYFLAVMVGMVMGGIQSLSRASFSSLITEKSDTTSFFSLMDVIYKGAIVTGTFLFGLAENLTGNMRNSVLVLGCLPLYFGFVFYAKNVVAASESKTSVWVEW